MDNKFITIRHNLDPKKFIWLWTKYVTGVNDKYHCTNSIRGKYSKKLTRHNDNFTSETIIVLDELSLGSYKAIYICGVASKGYNSKQNYIHNLHTAVEYKEDVVDVFDFEDWHLEVENGVFLHIPTIDELPEKYKTFPEDYVTCRIFRWAVRYFSKEQI